MSTPYPPPFAGCAFCQTSPSTFAAVLRVIAALALVPLGCGDGTTDEAPRTLDEAGAAAAASEGGAFADGPSADSLNEAGGTFLDGAQQEDGPAPGDGSSDGGRDAAPDARVDGGADGAPDARADAGRDGATEPGRDAGADARADAGPETGTEAGTALVVGFNGIAAWSTLSAAERARVDTARVAFLHQSVGQDLEDGVNANGVATDYVTSSGTVTAPGFSGGLFTTSNGNPLGKIAEWRAFALRNGPARLHVAAMKFGYADVEGDLTSFESAYASAAAAIRAAGMRVLHVTPPLVYNAPSDNAPKAQLRAWMLSAFPGDVIFDLADAESVDPVTGARCERGGFWEICARVRSTAACPSAGQGVDAPSGQGHLCAADAARVARAFLYAVHRTRP